MHKLDDVFVVVLAGGFGTRLWPLSRRNSSKQFLRLTEKDSLLGMTVQRLRNFVPTERIFIATIGEQVSQVLETLPDFPADNILVEPHKRGTGPCIGLASLYLERIQANATMLVVPSDHLILRDDCYIKALYTACIAAKDNSSLVTVGLSADRVASNYGHIKVGTLADSSIDGASVFRAEGFFEKPEPTLAREMFESGQYIWNTGTFCWTIKSFHDALRRFAPDFMEGLEAFRTLWPEGSENGALWSIYESLPDISVDYMLMEHADNVLVVRGEFGRLDVGDLNALAQLWPPDTNKNVGVGERVCIGSSGNIIHTSRQLVALVGVNDMVIVATDDVVLICRRDETQQIKKIVEILNDSGRTQYV